MAGSNANSAFCHLMVVISPAPRPSSTHDTRLRPPRVRAHQYVKAATAAIEGACVMLGSFTRYHSRNDPDATSAVADAASARETKSRGQPVAEPQPDQPVEQPGHAHRLPVRKRRAVGLDIRARGAQAGRRDVPRSEERRPRDGRSDGPGRLRVARRRRLEQVRLVAEPQEPVVVREVDVPVKPEGPRVGEVVEPVALEPGAEPHLGNNPDSERSRQCQRHHPICRVPGHVCAVPDEHEHDADARGGSDHDSDRGVVEHREYGATGDRAHGQIEIARADHSQQDGPDRSAARRKARGNGP